MDLTQQKNAPSHVRHKCTRTQRQEDAKTVHSTVLHVLTSLSAQTVHLTRYYLYKTIPVIPSATLHIIFILSNNV
jgi:hypothetical protein